MTDTVETRTLPIGVLTSTVSRYGTSVHIAVELATNAGARFLVSDGLLMPLTDCCGATAKGLEDYVGCRKCYEEIDPRYGDCEAIDSPNATRVVDSILGEFHDLPSRATDVPLMVAALRAEWDRQRAMLDSKAN